MTTRTRRRAAVLAAGALLSLQSVTAAPSASADPGCSGFQSGAFEGVCTGSGSPGSGDGGLPQRPKLAKYWWPVGPSYGDCVNHYNQKSTYRQMYSTYEPDRNAPIVDPPSEYTINCVIFFADAGPNIDDLKAKAKLQVKPPEIKADFNDKFLTGAPIAFSMGNSPTLKKDLDVPGYHVWLEAKPDSFNWEFGDGTTSGEAAPQHTYNSRPIDGIDSATQSVKVTLHVTWSGRLNINQIGADGKEEAIRTVQLDPLTVDSSIERPIVEVVPIPTERTSHA